VIQTCTSLSHLSLISLSLRYVIIDFRHVENVDYSGVRAFQDVRSILTGANITAIFTGLKPKVEQKLLAEGVIGTPPRKGFIIYKV
jgi:MFS superfamily sulfate permease-like transporter